MLRKVGDLITELIVTRRDEASLLAVKGVADVKFHTAYIEIVR